MNKNTTYNIASTSRDALPGLGEIVKHLPHAFSADGISLAFEPTFSGTGFRVAVTAAGATVSYSRPCDAYRALGALLAGLCPVDGIFEQRCAFESLGVMLDVSRNAVLRPAAIERLFRSFALMGINSVQLYMEDVYFLPEEPFFGYGRGPYTPEDLRRIDDYGHLLGIEVVPCIQTLGHLQQILQWPAYEQLMDVTGVLMVGDERSYRLIAKALDMLSSCFRTRTIHIGMDEAHGIGRGHYARLNGDRPAFDILNEHLQKVCAICAERGLQPMMWSDMYFRIGSHTHDYYDRDSRVPLEIANKIPPTAEMVYWDYYHEDAGFYEEWIDRHRLLGKEPVFASGAWTWGRFWLCMERVVTTNHPGMLAARRKNVRKAFITVWGDDGAEFHPFSMLAGVQYFAECAYEENPDFQNLEALFSVSSGGSFAACSLAAEIDTVPCVKGRSTPDANFGKWVLWHDPVLGFLNPQIPADLPEHYDQLFTKLERAARTDASGALAFPALLAKTLANKVRLHLEVPQCYREKNADKMRRLYQEILPSTLRGMEDLRKMHGAVWNEWNRPFGWEVIDSRYVTVIARLERLGEIIGAWLANPDSTIEEFEFVPQQIVRPENYPTMYFLHRRVMTPSVVS